MLRGDETTDDPVLADIRNFYKVELWTRDDRIDPAGAASRPASGS
jgi:hypothetical protein